MGKGACAGREPPPCADYRGARRAAGPAAYNAALTAFGEAMFSATVPNPTHPRALAATPFPRCAGQRGGLARGGGRSSASRSPASARRRCRSWWPTSATKTSAAAAGGHRARRPASAAACSAPRRPRRRWTSAASSTWPTGARAAPTPLVAGSVTRLADGRFDVRYRLWDAVKERAAAGPEQGRARAPTCAWPRTASPTRSTRSSPASAASTPPASPTSCAPAAASRCTSPTPTAKAGRWRWPAPSPSSRRPGRPTAGSWPTCPSRRRRPWSGCRTWAAAQRRMVANFRGSNSAPAWSPDGRRLAVTLSRDGRLAALHAAAPPAARRGA